MHSRKFLLAIAILLVATVIVISTLSVSNIEDNIDFLSDEPVITHIIGKEIKMEFSGIPFGSLGVLTVIRSVVGIFAILFLLFLAWRLLLVIEKLSDSFESLMQRKLSEGQDRET